MARIEERLHERGLVLPQLSLPQIRSGRVGDAVRRHVTLRISDRRFELRAESVRLCPATDASGPHCDMSGTIAVGAEGAVQQHENVDHQAWASPDSSRSPTA